MRASQEQKPKTFRKRRLREQPLPEPVVPRELPEEVRTVFSQALRDDQIKKGFEWIVKRISDEHPVLDLTQRYLDRYEEQIFQLQGHLLNGYQQAFRAALSQKCLEVLRLYRLELAEKGVNPVFLETWFKRKIICAIYQLSVHDLDRNIKASGQRGPVYLNNILERVVPETCLNYNWGG